MSCPKKTDKLQLKVTIEQAKLREKKIQDMLAESEVNKANLQIIYMAWTAAPNVKFVKRMKCEKIAN